MSKNIKREPTRLITFGNYAWVHWLTVTFFLLSGILITIVPCVLTGKIIAGPLIIGLILIALSLFCICDHIFFIRRKKEWEHNVDLNKLEL